ncbi:MT-A70 family protein [Oxytricha trifallax]|uniref:mRNA m(6)A methyltransferase n=1 Tax=Oxytricha trifallax TaxID=1172189 RepID=A0A073HX69_9SPIT|nr:MT-A70 family protein [Oxytricha trifallax]
MKILKDRNQQQQQFECEICKKPHKTLSGKEKHKTRNHLGLYGPSLLKKEKELLGQDLQAKTIEFDNFKQLKNEEIRELVDRITVLETENRVLKQQNVKLGKKKSSQTKIQMQKETNALINEITSNYAAYNINLLDGEVMAQFNQELCGKLADVVISDMPFPETMINFKYDIQTLQHLMNFQIEQIQENGYLFFWVTKKKLTFGLDFFKKHKYAYIDMIIWEKVDENGNFEGGPGYYLDHQFEICLIGRKGQVFQQMHLHTLPDIIRAPRRIASQKPNELYEIIYQLIPNARIIEAFARTNNIRRNHICLGNQIKDEKIRHLKYGKIV